jgi:hypothetical protein
VTALVKGNYEKSAIWRKDNPRVDFGCRTAKQPCPCEPGPPLESSLAIVCDRSLSDGRLTIDHRHLHETEPVFAA